MENVTTLTSNRFLFYILDVEIWNKCGFFLCVCVTDYTSEINTKTIANNTKKKLDPDIRLSKYTFPFRWKKKSLDFEG